ncbi:glycosyltransferase family 2 protein [Aliarcobacter butzleri]|uniref:glycosyltransferase family 2 protein n=1 Tax=Aliarcobacter butzleri TaxID=28197 RepID=UPI001260CA24|nr:glycosyltransferase family 2 protein [Aliarcobacter butzleri]
MTYIIILNYNGWEDTIECLESLKCIQEDYKIVLIDNKSTDNSIDKLEKWIQNQKELSSNLIFIKSSENNGYAAGNNIGIKYVESQEDAEFIWILNNDTLIKADILENLLNCYKNLENENIALLGSKILNEDFSIQSIGYLNSKYTEDEIKSKSSIEVEHISGCSIFFRADKIKEIGYIPEEYFLYYEETDWMKSIKQKGFKIFTCLSSQLIHKHAKSTGGIYSPFVIYYMTRNQILFNKKYLNSIQYYLFITKMISRNLLKIIFYAFKNLKSSKSIFTGTIDGILNKKGKKEF